jgi:hypothetical protein
LRTKAENSDKVRKSRKFTVTLIHFAEVYFFPNFGPQPYLSVVWLSWISTLTLSINTLTLPFSRLAFSSCLPVFPLKKHLHGVSFHPSLHILIEYQTDGIRMQDNISFYRSKRGGHEQTLENDFA